MHGCPIIRENLTNLEIYVVIPEPYGVSHQILGINALRRFTAPHLPALIQIARLQHPLLE